MAFSLGADTEEIRKTFSVTKDLIFREGKVWIPLEITMTQDDFLSIWQKGAAEWREFSDKDQAGFYPMYESWKLYEPVGLPGTEAELPPIDREKVINMFRLDVEKIITREVYPRAAELEVRIKNSNRAYKYQNQLGVLYGRYGLYEKAIEVFQQVLAVHSYLPSYLNMGNIYFLLKDYEQALIFYKKVEEQSSGKDSVLLSIARTYYELQDFQQSEQYFESLHTVNPGLAEKYSYLAFQSAGGSRALDVESLRSQVIWEEIEEGNEE